MLKIYFFIGQYLSLKKISNIRKYKNSELATKEIIRKAFQMRYSLIVTRISKKLIYIYIYLTKYLINSYFT